MSTLHLRRLKGWISKNFVCVEFPLKEKVATGRRNGNHVTSLEASRPKIFFAAGVKHFVLKLRFFNEIGVSTMRSDAVYHSATSSKMMKLSSLHVVIRMHHYISTHMIFEITKFCHNLFFDCISQFDAKRILN